MDSRFPLLCLPLKAVLNVLQSMDILEKITFSLISKTTKSYCLKVRLHASFDLIINSTIEMEMHSERTRLIFELTHIEQHRRSDGPIRITAANVVTVQKTEDYRFNHQTSHELQKDGFSVRDWIWHMKDITKQKRINIEMYANASRLDVDSIAKMLAGFDIHHLNIHFLLHARRFYRSILEKIHPKSITMPRNPYHQNPELIQKVLCQNFVQLRLINGMPSTLNDILVINSPVILIEYYEQLLTMNTINRFIKLWQAGSSGRLRYLGSMFQRDLIADANVILKGIKHSVIGREVWRPFVDSIYGHNRVRLMNGGYDLFRKDGIKATVFVRVEGFEMFVWD